MSNSTSKAIHNCNLVNVLDGSIHNDVTIHIENGIIDRIDHDTNHATNTQIFDGKNSYVIPGLIDMHVHIYADMKQGRNSLTTRRSDLLIGLSASNNLQEALAAGITTVRDLGAPREAAYDIKQAWKSGLIRGACPYISGQMITAIGGHGNELNSDLGIGVCGVDSIIRAVRTAIAKGADCIKLVTSGSVTKTELTFPELCAGIDEAHWCGVPVACHATLRTRSSKNAVRAACDTLEHGFELDDETIDEMLSRGTYLCPTITAISRVVSNANQFGGTQSNFVTEMQRLYDLQKDSFQRALKRGVKIIAGTDAGVPFVKFNDLITELEFMIRYGMNETQALMSATYTAAEALGKLNEIGIIECGKKADIVFVEDNPLRNISALRKVICVMQNGEFVSSCLCPILE